ASNETGFKVERSGDSSGPWSQFATPGANATTHSDTGLVASTTYYYRIRATNAGGDSAYSNGVSAMTSPAGGGSCVPRSTGDVTDRNVYADPPAPALPAAGGTFIDPVFGTTIMRLTDEGDGADCSNPYSYWPTFNKDSTRLFVQCGSGAILYGFDPVNFS